MTLREANNGLGDLVACPQCQNATRVGSRYHTDNEGKCRVHKIVMTVDAAHAQIHRVRSEAKPKP